MIGRDSRFEIRDSQKQEHRPQAGSYESWRSRA